MFSGVRSLDPTSKKAVSTGVGFVGFFGYMGHVIQGNGPGWVVQHHGWDAGLWFVLGATAIAMILLSRGRDVRPRG
jgi:OPA family glycerol-3-phosphate transporter-like MFS transporter